MQHLEDVDTDLRKSHLDGFPMKRSGRLLLKLIIFEEALAVLLQLLGSSKILVCQCLDTNH
jgi:hypothetical protein